MRARWGMMAIQRHTGTAVPDDLTLACAFTAEGVDG